VTKPASPGASNGKSKKCGRGYTSANNECRIGKPEPQAEKRSAGDVIKGAAKTAAALGVGTAAASVSALPGAYAGAAASTGVGVLGAKAAILASQILPASTTANIATALGLSAPNITAMTVATFGATTNAVPMLGGLAASQAANSIALSVAPYLVPAGAVVGLAVGGYLGYKVTKKLLGDSRKKFKGAELERAESLINATGQGDTAKIRKETRAFMQTAKVDRATFDRHRRGLRMATSPQSSGRIDAKDTPKRSAVFDDRKAAIEDAIAALAVAMNNESSQPPSSDEPQAERSRSPKLNRTSAQRLKLPAPRRSASMLPIPSQSRA
jgi:hypothetical protein